MHAINVLKSGIFHVESMVDILFNITGRAEVMIALNTVLSVFHISFVFQPFP